MAAIITGSDSGIGKATAVALAKRGHDIGVTYNRDEQGAKETAEEVRASGRRAEVRHLDLAQTESVQPTISEMIRRPPRSTLFPYRRFRSRWSPYHSANWRVSALSAPLLASYSRWAGSDR